MPVSAVMFDLDETLFDRSESLRAFVEDQLARMMPGSIDNPKMLVDRFIELDRRGRVSKRDVYQHLLAEISWADERASTRLFDDYERNAWRFAKAFAGTEALLSWLRERCLPIAIVSNGETHIQLRSLLALNLDRLVDAYLISEREGLRKPDPAIFRRAAERLHVPVETCVFVGDSPEADMIGARDLGMKTIWFPNGAIWPDSYDWRPDATIGSLTEIQGLIDIWSNDQEAARPDQAVTSCFERFELRRMSDDLVYSFSRQRTAEGEIGYRRADGDFWIVNKPGFGWVAWDEATGLVSGRPWTVLPADQADHPPEGTWVSRKDIKSYVYSLVYV